MSHGGAIRGEGGSLGDVVDDGPGCKIAHGLALSRTLLMPQTSLKVVFSYSRVTSDATSGLTFAGTWDVLQRQPAISILGPAGLKAERETRSAPRTRRSPPICARR